MKKDKNYKNIDHPNPEKEFKKPNKEFIENNAKKHHKKYHSKHHRKHHRRNHHNYIYHPNIYNHKYDLYNPARYQRIFVDYPHKHKYNTIVYDMPIHNKNNNKLIINNILWLLLIILFILFVIFNFKYNK